MQNLIEREVLERFRKGDQQAIGPLLERVRPYIRTIVRTAFGDRPEVGVSESDLVQDVFLQAVRANGTFRGESYGEFVCWLRTIAVRISRNALWKSPDAGNSPQLLDEQFVIDDTPDPHASVIEQEDSARMADALQRLPAEMRQVVTLRLVEGLAHSEIATRTGKSAGAVRMLFLRALEQLREECGNPEDWQ
jgi:RNA polymerase sigma-70 factor (ECF subfamily)